MPASVGSNPAAGTASRTGALACDSMPEGHTIHRLARDHTRDLAGRKVHASSPQGRFSASAALLDGRTLERADAWGKHLFHRFDDGQVLHVHLGLIGKFRRHTAPVPDPVGLVRLRLEGEHVAWDLSGPNVCRVITPDEMVEVTSKLGPDPLRRGADPQRFLDKVRRSTKPIGTLLLDQTVVAGIGNVYRAEVLFRLGIHPSTPGNQLTDDQLTALWAEVVAQLRDGLKRGRIAMSVYHHDVCNQCGGTLSPMRVANRRIDVCSTCQR